MEILLNKKGRPIGARRAVPPNLTKKAISFPLSRDTASYLATSQAFPAKLSPTFAL